MGILPKRTRNAVVRLGNTVGMTSVNARMIKYISISTDIAHCRTIVDNYIKGLFGIKIKIQQEWDK